MPKWNSRVFGSEGERMAAEFLAGQGFEILERNYRAGRLGEIDLIAKKGEILIFVEVKRRRGAIYGGPLYSISTRKKKAIRSAASQYLAAHPQHHSREVLCRFDMISYENGVLRWIEDIFR
jgi:putative endonuclease